MQGTIKTVESVREIQPLTPGQYEQAKLAAEQAAKAQHGEKPRRRDYAFEAAPIWTLWDIPALIIMLAALLLSTAHIMTHMGKQAAETYPAVSQLAGDIWDTVTYGRVHQYAALAMAEAAVLLFMMLFAAMPKPAPTGSDSDGKPAYDSWQLAGWLAQKGLFLGLAVAAGVFVFNANLQSGTGWLESVLPPALTLGLGLYLERKLGATLERQNDITAQYRQALTGWQLAQRDITAHESYRPLLRKTIADSLEKLPHNAGLYIPHDILAEAVAREMLRDELWQRSDRGYMAAVTRKVQAGGASWQPQQAPQHTTAPQNGKSPQPVPQNGTQPHTALAGANGNGKSTANGKS